MSVRVKQLHLFIENCLDLAEHMRAGPARDLMLDLADDFAAQAVALDAEGAPILPVMMPGIPGREAASLSEPEKD